MNNLRFDIHDLDNALDSLPHEGATILLAGQSRLGISTLATQYVFRAPYQGESVVFLDDTEHPETIYHRVASLHTGIPFEEIQDRPWADPESGDACTNPILNRNRNQLLAIDSRNAEVKQFLDNASIWQPFSGHLAAVVIDGLAPPGQMKFSSPSQKSRYLDALAARIKNFACQHRCTVIATTGVRPWGKSTQEIIDPSMIVDCKTMGEHFDAIIGVSCLPANEVDRRMDPDASQSTEQFVTISGLGKPKKVRVRTDFGRARFEESATGAGDGPIDPATGESDAEKALSIRESTERAGWAPMNRGELEAVLELRYPPAVGVYFCLAARANTRTNLMHPGEVFLAVKTLVELLDLTTKQVRIALKKLEKTGVIFKSGDRKVGRGTPVRIVRTVKMGTDFEKSGYFRLYRNLTDTAKDPLRKDPLKLAVWAICLLKARYKRDDTERLLPGEFKFLKYQFADWLPVELPEVVIINRMQALVGEGRLHGLNGNTVEDKAFIRVANWSVYQSARLTGGGSRLNLREKRQTKGQTEGQTEGQRRGNGGATEGQPRRR